MLKIKFVIVILLTVLVIQQPLFAQEMEIKTGDVLTLDKCIDIAVRNNPNIGLAEHATKVYESRIGQAKSGYLPQLNVSSGYSRANPMANARIDSSSNQYSGSVSLNQLIYDFGKTPAKAKIQELNLDSSRWEVDNTIIQIAENVKQAYYSALLAQLNKDIYAQSIKQNEQHLKQAKAFFEIGTKSKIDVTTAQVNVSNANLNYIKASDEYRTAVANLNNTMGIPEAPEYSISDTVTFKRPPSLSKESKVSSKSIGKSKSAKDFVLKSSVEKQSFTDDLSLKKYDITLNEAVKKAYENRPDLKSLVIKEQAASENVKLVRKDYFPTVSGFAGYGWGGQEFPLDRGWSAGANLNVPVFNGLLTKNQVDEAKANVEMARSNIAILKQNIYLQIQQAYINLNLAEKKIPVAEITVKQARENLDLANGRYKVGVGNSIEVQDAETNYNNAQLQYVQAFYDYNTARSNLERAMGVR